LIITHSKAAFLLGNSFYSISYYQKEFPSNFLFPSIYYLFGKYSSKSNSKSLKVIGISCLKEVSRLLYEDLQFSSMYWLGNIYYNCGDYMQCHKLWSLYSENYEKSFDYSVNKLEKIQQFMAKFEYFCNSFNGFKRNLNFLKKTFTILSPEEVNNFLLDANEIQYKITPNIRENYEIIYEYYKAKIYFYGARDIKESIKLLLNIINKKNNFMRAHFLVIKILKTIGDYSFLLKYCIYTIKISHSDNVTTAEWLKAYLLYSKALFLNEMSEDAIDVLRNILDIFAYIALDEIKFLNEINKTNKISLTNVFVDFNHALNFYSKFHVYEKCEKIFRKKIPKKVIIPSEDILIKVDNSFCHSDLKNVDEEDLFEEDMYEATIEQEEIKLKAEKDQTNANDISNNILTSLKNGIDQKSYVRRFSELESKFDSNQPNVIDNICIDSKKKLKDYVNNSINNTTVKSEDFVCKYIIKFRYKYNLRSFDFV